MSYLFVLSIVSLLIVVHELGHFAAARLAGIPIQRFSIGVGRAIWAVRCGETEYRLSLVPLGGYVLPASEQYFEQPPIRRMLFALAGPLANLVLAFAMLAGFNAVTSGLSAQALFTEPARQTMDALRVVAHALPQAVSGSQAAVGPLGVLAQGSDLIGSSLLLALQFAIVMSVNLAVINMLPIPPLDGGRALLCLFEVSWARVQRLNVPLNVAGFFAIVALLVWLTIVDVRRLLVRLLA